jgi:hypothetical protein
MTKKILIFIFALFLSIPTKSQTAISPFIGYDLQGSNYTTINVEKRIAKTNSFAFGLQLEQGLIGDFGLAYTFDYTQKDVRAPVEGFDFHLGYSYEQFRNSLEVKFYALRFVHFSLGLTQTSWENVRLITWNVPPSIQFGYFNTKHLAASGSIRAKFHSFFLDLVYVKWLPKEQVTYPMHDISDTQNLGIRLGYSAQLLKKREKSKVRCPKF